MTANANYSFYGTARIERTPEALGGKRHSVARNIPNTTSRFPGFDLSISGGGESLSWRMLTTVGALARRMTFKPNQTLSLPELAAHVGLASAEFRVVDVLAGGMGECVRVAQGKEVFALKVIRDHLVEDADAWNRYLREARIWTTLSACDGVAEAFCITRVNEIPVVCSRWMPGGNLRGHLKNRSPEFFFRVIARVVGTLAWVREEHEIIHRDIKPENILLDEANLAFVSDWGLARPLTVATSEGGDGAPTRFTGAAHPALTAVGSFLGTVSYASPEQLLGTEDLDHRTDIYSLACLMYEWEAGSLPFTGFKSKAKRIGPKISMGVFTSSITAHSRGRSTSRSASDCYRSTRNGDKVWPKSAGRPGTCPKSWGAAQRLCVHSSASIFLSHCSGRALNLLPARTRVAWLRWNAQKKT